MLKDSNKTVIRRTQELSLNKGGKYVGFAMILLLVLVGFYLVVDGIRTDVKLAGDDVNSGKLLVARVSSLLDIDHLEKSIEIINQFGQSVDVDTTFDRVVTVTGSQFHTPGTSRLRYEKNSQDTFDISLHLYQLGHLLLGPNTNIATASAVITDIEKGEWFLV